MRHNGSADRELIPDTIHAVSQVVDDSNLLISNWVDATTLGQLKRGLLEGSGKDLKPCADNI